MTKEQLVIAFFESEPAADEAVEAIKQWDKDSKDVKLGAIGILAKDESGEVKVHKVGKRKTGTGLAIGAVAGVLSGGLTVIGGAIGGAAIGHFFHAKVKLSDEEKERINGELDQGKAAVVIAAKAEEADLVVARLAELGGMTETHKVTDEEPAEAPPSIKPSATHNIRPGSKTMETVLKTDELYGHDGLWLGPRGRDYGAMLPNPKPYQHANLYPDPNSSYWFAFMQLPEGSVLELRGQFPHCRYFQFALYREDPDMGAYTATGEKFVDHEIEPNAGSVNPFVPGTDRSVENRDYTLRISTADAPADAADRQPNTLYAGSGAQIQVVYRVYQPDQGYLGDSGVGLPAYTAILADGTELAAEQVREQFNRPLLKGVPPGMPVQQWRALCGAPDNDPELKPETTPARNPPLLERYFNNKYNLVGIFKPPEVRAKMSAAVETGFGGDPETLFMIGFLSRGFGPVVVIRGKMSFYPDNWYGDDGNGLQVMTDWETRYMSLIVSEAPPSGMGTDGMSDFQIPLDEDRNYTIVISREEDRPANATDENGVAWVDWGHRGEGIADDLNREDYAFIVFRFMHNNPNWKHNPQNIVEPGTEEEVMGPYFPKMSYTTKEAFEAKEG